MKPSRNYYLYGLILSLASVGCITFGLEPMRTGSSLSETIGACLLFLFLPAFPIPLVMVGGIGMEDRRFLRLPLGAATAYFLVILFYSLESRRFPDALNAVVFLFLSLCALPVLLILHVGMAIWRGRIRRRVSAEE